jgi:hypothetical protein
MKESGKVSVSTWQPKHGAEGRQSYAKITPEQLKKDIAQWIKGGEDDTKLYVKADLEANLEMLHPGTCTWLFEEPGYQNWFNLKSNAIAWYTAPMGTGKSVTASAVIRHLEAQGKQVVYFFYSFSDPSRSKALSAFRSLALQLLTILETIPNSVKDLYAQEVDNWNFTLQSQNFSTTIKLVLELLKQCKRVHIVIDGLDECKDEEIMLSLLEKIMAAETYGITKWFLTSRKEGDIAGVMSKLKATVIEPPQDKLNGDIRVFMRDKLQDLEKCSNCVQKWSAKSAGSFLYAKLMFGILSGQGLTCDEDIEEELNKFPTGLRGAYTRSLERLSRHSDKEQELVRYVGAEERRSEITIPGLLTSY